MMIRNNQNLIASTMTYRASSLEEALTSLKQNGFDKVELCTVGEWIPHFDLARTTDEAIEDTARMAARIGIEVVAINISGGNVDDNNDFISDQLAYVNNAFKLARRLGAQFVTHACGSIKPEQNRAARLAAITSFNKIAADIGEKYGITYAVEAPHKMSIAEKADEIAAYWAMQDPRIKCTFDVAHLTYAGIDPVEQARIYAGRTIHVHLRDAIPGNSLLRYGEGTVDFAAVIQVFQDSGYQGCYAMEYPCDTKEESAERMQQSIAFMHRLFGQD